MIESQPKKELLNNEGESKVVYKTLRDSVENGCTVKELRDAFILNRELLTEEQRTKLALLLAERFEKMASTDTLTQLLNRTLLKPKIEKIIKELNSDIEKRKLPIKAIMVILLDINDFKILNDEYGHLAGDEALKILAVRLEKSVKREDTVFRVGGDEFAVLLPITDDNSQSLEKIFDRIKNKVNEQLLIQVGDKNIPFNVSMGYGALKRGDKITIKELFEKVDEEMYKDKEYSKQV